MCDRSTLPPVRHGLPTCVIGKHALRHTPFHLEMRDSPTYRPHATTPPEHAFSVETSVSSAFRGLHLNFVSLACCGHAETNPFEIILTEIDKVIALLAEEGDKDSLGALRSRPILLVFSQAPVCDRRSRCHCGDPFQILAESGSTLVARPPEEMFRMVIVMLGSRAEVANDAVSFHFGPERRPPHSA